MDSSATVLEGGRAEWIPFCRACRVRFMDSVTIESISELSD
jgi:hypothetical protein